MYYEKPEMDIVLYDMRVALTTVSGGMDNEGTIDGDEVDLPM